MSALSPALAAEKAPALFKIVTVKDEIVVAAIGEDAGTLGTDPGNLGRAIKGKGELTVWQYAVRKGQDGQLEQAPLRKISVLAHDSLRVEPYSSPLRIVPAE